MRSLRAVSARLHGRPTLEALEDRCLLSAAYLQTNLVSDISGIARFTDPNLVNPWGLAYAPKGPFWVSDNNAGVSTLYNGQGAPQSLVVSIPSPFAGQSGTPTGVVFNGGSDFVVKQGKASGAAAFIFVTEDGTIDGWSPKVNLNNAIQVVDNSVTPTPADGAVYKGATLGSDPDGRSLLYVANFRAGTIEVYDDHFRPTTVGGDFTDPNIPAGFAPFDVANLGGKLYVTYAKQNAAKHDDVAGAGNGFVDVFDTNGHLQKRLISHGPLNSPWGLALAPAKFGKFSNDLLVGNFGDGHIDAFNPKTGQFLGALTDPSGNPITIGGLWALKFGNGGQAGPTTTLFFTAGIGDEGHGLFGELQAVNISFVKADPVTHSNHATAAGQTIGNADIVHAMQSFTVNAGTEIGSGGDLNGYRSPDRSGGDRRSVVGRTGSSLGQLERDRQHTPRRGAGTELLAVVVESYRRRRSVFLRDCPRRLIGQTLSVILSDRRDGAGARSYLWVPAPIYFLHVHFASVTSA